MQDPRYDRIFRPQRLPIIIERDIPIERDQLQRPVLGQANNLGGVENQANVVEGRGNETARADPPALVLVYKCFLESEGREESADAGDEVFELGRTRDFFSCFVSDLDRSAFASE